jgi:glutamate racemase
MKIGIFDSGLGGLIITQSVIKKLPRYDYIYLGDTARVPYGDRSEETIYRFVRQAVEFLFKKGCGLVVVACNTASANALRKIQQDYLPRHYPDRRVLGVIIPTAEEAALHGKVGVIATASTVRSKAHMRELKKLNSRVLVYQQAAARLVPLIEKNDFARIDRVLEGYLKPLGKKGIEALILGCTHYPILKGNIRKILGPGIKIIDQTEIIPPKLENYLSRHPEINAKLSKGGKRGYFVTKRTKEFNEVARLLAGKKIPFKLARLGKKQ